MLSNNFTVPLQNVHPLDNNFQELNDSVYDLSPDIFSRSESRALDLIYTNRRKKSFWNLIRVIGDLIYKASTERCFASCDALGKLMSQYQESISGKRIRNILCEQKELTALLLTTSAQENHHGHWQSVERNFTPLGHIVYGLLLTQSVDKHRSKRTRCTKPGHGKTKPGTQSSPTHDHIHDHGNLNMNKDIKTGASVDKPDGITHNPPPFQSKSVFNCLVREKEKHLTQTIAHPTLGNTIRCPKAHEIAKQKVRKHFEKIRHTTQSEVTEVYNLYYTAALNQLTRDRSTKH